MEEVKRQATEGGVRPYMGSGSGATVRGGTATVQVLMALVGVLAGTAAQLQQAVLWPVLGYVALGLLVAALVAGLVLARRVALQRVSRLAMVGWLIAASAGACIGAAWTGLRASAFLADAMPAGLEGRDLRVSGVVAQMPQRSEVGLRFQFAVQEARWMDAAGASNTSGAADASTPPAVPPLVSLSWYADRGAAWGRTTPAPNPSPARLPTLHAGDHWQFTVRLKAPHGNRNPHGFDYELWLWEQGVQATGYVRTGARDAAPERLGGGWRHPVERAREAVRDAILARAGGDADDGIVPAADAARARAAGVVAALVTGDQAAIEREDWDVFRATGVAHLMSISGLHITMFAWLATAAIVALWRRSERLTLWRPAPQAALVGGVLLAAAYALFSGWGVPAQRTVCMLAVVALLRGGGRQWPWPCTWLVVCAAVVVLDSWALLQPGFWLSFVAVGVLFAGEAGRAPAAGAVGLGLRARLLRLLREQALVTLALTPLGLLLFQQVSLVGFVANLLAIPWVTLVVTPLAMLGVLLPPLWSLAALAVQALGALLQPLAAWPHATMSVAAAPLVIGVAGVLGGLLLAMRLPPALRLMGLPLLLPVLWWQAPRPAPGEFDLLAMDIGQGNAVLLRTARHSLLYDAGPRYSADSDAGHRVLVPLLRAHGERIDTLMLSHRDSDHTGGAAAVLAMQPQAALRSSLEPAHPLQALRPSQRCEAGQHWTWDGVRFEVVHPQSADYMRFGGQANALSCVLRVSNDRATVLLAGDIERVQEAVLTARHAAIADALRADLLLVPHHGSRSSSSDALLDAVAPRVAVVQNGWRNRFGHPAAEVVTRYRQRGITLVDSPRCGAAHWRSAEPTALRCEREEGARYWQHRPPPEP